MTWRIWIKKIMDGQEYLGDRFRWPRAGPGTGNVQTLTGGFYNPV
jgi:hypothetical protein